jgi:hypothetical protein
MNRHVIGNLASGQKVARRRMRIRRRVSRPPKYYPNDRRDNPNAAAKAIFNAAI